MIFNDKNKRLPAGDADFVVATSFHEFYDLRKEYLEVKDDFIRNSKIFQVLTKSTSYKNAVHEIVKNFEGTKNKELFYKALDDKIFSRHPFNGLEQNKKHFLILSIIENNQREGLRSFEAYLDQKGRTFVAMQQEYTAMKTNTMLIHARLHDCKNYMVRPFTNKINKPANDFLLPVVDIENATQLSNKNVELSTVKEFAPSNIAVLKSRAHVLHNKLENLKTTLANQNEDSIQSKKSFLTRMDKEINELSDQVKTYTEKHAFTKSAMATKLLQNKSRKISLYKKTKTDLEAATNIIEDRKVYATFIEESKKLRVDYKDIIHNL